MVYGSRPKKLLGQGAIGGAAGWDMTKKWFEDYLYLDPARLLCREKNIEQRARLSQGEMDNKGE